VPPGCPQIGGDHCGNRDNPTQQHVVGGTGAHVAECGRDKESIDQTRVLHRVTLAVALTRWCVVQRSRVDVGHRDLVHQSGAYSGRRTVASMVSRTRWSKCPVTRDEATSCDKSVEQRSDVIRVMGGSVRVVRRSHESILFEGPTTGPQRGLRHRARRIVVTTTVISIHSDV